MTSPRSAPTAQATPNLEGPTTPIERCAEGSIEVPRAFLKYLLDSFRWDAEEHCRSPEYIEGYLRQQAAEAGIENADDLVRLMFEGVTYEEGT